MSTFYFCIMFREILLENYFEDIAGSRSAYYQLVSYFVVKNSFIKRLQADIIFNIDVKNTNCATL